MLSRDIYLNTVATSGCIYKISTKQKINLNLFFVSVSNDIEISIDTTDFNKSVVSKFILKNKLILNKTNYFLTTFNFHNKIYLNVSEGITTLARANYLSKLNNSKSFFDNRLKKEILTY